MKNLKQKYKKWWIKEGIGCDEKDCVICGDYDWELDWENYVEGFLKEILSDEWKQDKENK